MKHKEIEKENKNLNNNIPPLSKESSPHFKKPSLEEVRLYCFERNNAVSPEAFFSSNVICPGIASSSASRKTGKG